MGVKSRKTAVQCLHVSLFRDKDHAIGNDRFF